MAGKENLGHPFHGLANEGLDRPMYVPSSPRLSCLHIGAGDWIDEELAVVDSMMLIRLSRVPCVDIVICSPLVRIDDKSTSNMSIHNGRTNESLITQTDTNKERKTDS